MIKMVEIHAYDLKGRLVAVTDADGKDVERYVYDPAGNILEKTMGGKKATYTYDKANQLVSSTDADGKVTEYAYDAAGRLVKEGGKTYRYGYLDKVLSVTEGKTRHTYSYHVDGQLASVTKHQAGKAPTGRAASPLAAETEEFFWDGLALVKRGGTSYVNEPHPGGGAAVLSSKDGVMFNDILGTTLGVEGEGGYTATPLTAFGDALPSLGGSQSLATASSQPSTLNPQPLFTGKPLVDGLGHAFLFRNYRAGLGKWLTADPLGYPDGWNQLAYGVNSPLEGFDYLGADWNYISFGIEKRFDAGDATIPIVVAPNPNGIDQYDILYPQNIRDAIDKFIENNEPLDPSVAEWLFNAHAPSHGFSMDIGGEIDSKMRSMGIYDYEIVSIEQLKREFDVEVQSVGVVFYNAYFLWLVHVRYE